MTNKIKMAGLVTVILLASTGCYAILAGVAEGLTDVAVIQATMPVGYGGPFSAQLSPYGVWTMAGGTSWVWIPYAEVVGPDWGPYADGEWRGCPWGLAICHYGWWDFSDAYGWFWIPGTEWCAGPRWHSRWGGGFIGTRGFYGGHGIVTPRGNVIPHGAIRPSAPHQGAGAKAAVGGKAKTTTHRTTSRKKKQP